MEKYDTESIVEDSLQTNVNGANSDVVVLDRSFVEDERGRANSTQSHSK
jgi:hypothetical protein